jgi:hypothetical protein
VNPQPIIDLEPAERQGERTLLAISQPVLQRLVDGRTRGLAIRPLGALSAAFYGRDGGVERAPRLRFAVRQ